MTMHVNAKLNTRIIFGTLTHLTATPPDWGETIGIFENMGNTYDIPLAVYSTRGDLYIPFVIRGSDGALVCYGEDRKRLQYLNEVLQINA